MTNFNIILHKMHMLFECLVFVIVLGPGGLLFIYNIIKLEESGGWFCSMCIYSILKLSFNELYNLPLSMLGVIGIALYKCYCYLYVALMDLEDWLQESSMKKLKRKYLEFLLKRLFIAVDRLDRLYLRRPLTGESVSELLEMQYAYEEILKEIALFRQDVRKVYYPNQLECKEMPEIVYGITNEERELIKNSTFANVKLRTDYEFVRQLMHS